MLNESPFIDQSMVIGEGEKFASALISPNQEALRKWSAEKGITTTMMADLITHPEVIKHYKDKVEQVNTRLELHQNLKRTRLVAEEWTPESGCLSPTLKLKRRVLLEKYQNLIREIFGG